MIIENVSLRKKKQNFLQRSSRIFYKIFKKIEENMLAS